MKDFLKYTLVFLAVVGTFLLLDPNDMRIPNAVFLGAVGVCLLIVTRKIRNRRKSS